MEEEKKDVKKQDTKSTEKVEKKETKPAEKKEEKKVDKKVDDKKVTTEVKKKETKKEPTIEKKKTNVGIIIGIVVVVAILVVILAYMFLMANSPKKSIETMLSDLKSGNYNKSILYNVLEEENFNQEAEKLLFERLEWKILNVKEEGNTATVELEITNKDFKTILGNYMQKMFKLAFTGQNPNEEEMTNYLMEELKNSEIQNVTVKQSIILEKKDGKWEVTEENNFINILLPGFTEAIDSFSK